MTEPDHWNAVERLFHEAVERPRAERSAFLASACGGDEALRKEVESLLAQDDERVLDEPALDVAAREIAARQKAARAGAGDETPSLVGRRLRGYEVLSLLGAGGMGEVYRARDTTLGREVALKLLPRELSSDPERLGRLEREARLLASLEHPSIAVLHSLEEAEGRRFLVMELVPGPTLAERLHRGPLPLAEALAVGRQMAEALEAAHDRGVIHRDLKPGNVKVTPDGRVKLLDFGLAKALTEAGGEAEPTPESETTRDGAILGTPAYMSPEQARGEAVDRRTDVWSFGCCLYEALSGRRAFAGTTTSDTLAAVLDREPDWSALPERTPAGALRVLRRCLTKDVRHRLHHIGDARLELEEAAAGRDEPPEVRPRRRVPGFVAAAVVALTAVGVVVVSRWSPSRPSSLPRLTNAAKLTAALGVEDYPTWSPDGRTLAYQSNQSGNWDIWVTQVGSAHAVNRTADSTADDTRPSWSPDGQWIAFCSLREGGGYFLMPAVGGTARKVASGPPGKLLPSRAGWSPDSTQIVYAVDQLAEPRLEILTLSSRVSKTLPLPVRPRNNVIVDLSWSPDGHWLAYARTLGDPAATSELWVTRTSDGESVQLTDGTARDRSPTWPDSRGLYFVSDRGGTADLWRHAIRDDLPESGPQQVTSGIEMAQAAFSGDGRRLAYTVGRHVQNGFRAPLLASRPATWTDTTQLTFDEAEVESIDVSGDSRLVFSSTRGGNWDLWTMPAGGGPPQQLTMDPAIDGGPRWKPDGSEVLFFSSRSGHREAWIMPIGGGPARQVTRGESECIYPAWASGGQDVVRFGEGLSVAPARGGEERPLTSDPGDGFPDSSPDGRWIAFFSDRDGVPRIWRVPASGGRAEWLTEGGGTPRWSRDSKEIYFIGLEEQWNVWVLSLDTRHKRPVTALTGRPGKLAPVALATDGQSLYFAWADPRGDIWVADVVQPPGR